MASWGSKSAVVPFPLGAAGGTLSLSYAVVPSNCGCAPCVPNSPLLPDGCGLAPFVLTQPLLMMAVGLAPYVLTQPLLIGLTLGYCEWGEWGWDAMQGRVQHSSSCCVGVGFWVDSMVAQPVWTDQTNHGVDQAAQWWCMQGVGMCAFFWWLAVRC